MKKTELHRLRPLHWGQMPPLEAGASHRTLSRSVALDTAPPISFQSIRVPTVVRWAFYLFSFMIPLEVVNLGQVLGGIPNLTSLAGVLLVACCFLYSKRCFARPHRTFWWILIYLLFLIFQGLSIQQSLVGEFLGRLETLIQLVIMFCVSSTLLRDTRCARGVLLSFSAASALLSMGMLVGIPGLATLLRSHAGERLTTADTNPNYVAYLVVFAAVILIGLLLEKSIRGPLRKGMSVAVTLLLLALTVATGSRAGMGSLVLGLSLYLLPFGKSRKRMVVMIWGIVAIATVVYLALISPVASERWGETYYEGKTAHRSEIFLTSAYMIAERPILGWGPVVNEIELGHRLGYIRKNPHNLYLQLFLEVGTFGAIPFLIAIYLCLRTAWKGRFGGLGLLPLALLTTTLVANLAHERMDRKPTWLMLALAVSSAPLGLPRRNSLVVRLRARSL